MPQITSPLSTPTGMPALNSAHLGKAAGLRIHFALFSDFTAAITTGTSSYAADLWADGQEMTIASEADSGAVRVWRTALGHARTVKVGRLEVVLPANSNVVLAAAGVPVSGTGANGDLSVDKAAGIAYLKTAGAWASAGNISSLSSATAAAVEAAKDAGSNFMSGTLGPVPDLATLNSTYPAASSQGKSASVGSAAPYATYDCDGSAWRPRLKAGSAGIRTRGLWKPAGGQATIVQGQGGNGNCRIMKREAEAPFSRVRLWMLNRGPTGMDNVKFAVAVTDELAIDTATNAFAPRRNGVTYNSPATSSSPVGWKVGTWGGSISAESANGGVGSASVLSPLLYPGSGFESPSYRPGIPTFAIPDIVCSDWVPLDSIDPLTTPPSGIKRPLILLALGRVVAGSVLPVVWPDGYSVEFTAAQQNAKFTAWMAATDPAARLEVVAPATGADPIGSGTLTLPGGYTPPPNWAGSASANMLYFALEFDYDVPVRSFGFFGDSNIESYNGFSDAVASVSTPARPYVWCNMGMSTNRWQEFESGTLQYLKHGAPFTDLIIPSFSHNDLGTEIGNSVSGAGNGRNGAAWEFARQRERVLRILDVCDQLGIKAWIWTHFKGYDLSYNPSTGLPAAEPETVIHNQWCRDLCASGRATLIDVTNIAPVPGAPNTYQVDNGGGPASVTSQRLLNDGTHSTAAGTARAKAITIAALKAEGGLS